MRRILLFGNREISRLSVGVIARTASGRPEAIADDERPGEVGPAHSSWEAGERSGASREGVSGAKGRDQRECGPAKHGPERERGSRVTCAGPHTGVLVFLPYPSFVLKPNLYRLARSLFCGCL